LRILGLILRDVFTSRFMKVLYVFLGVWALLWLLFVPTVFVLQEGYSRVPVLNSINILENKDGSKGFDEGYKELFRDSYSDPAGLTLPILTLILLVCILWPIIVLFIGLVVLVGLYIGIRDLIYHIPKIPRNIKNYINGLKKEIETRRIV